MFITESLLKYPVIKDLGDNAKYIKLNYKIKRSDVPADKLLTFLFGDIEFLNTINPI
jgi:hypothetical protein